MKDPSTRRRYTLEFKEQAVKRVLSGHGVAAVARDLGISDSLDPQLAGPSPSADRGGCCAGGAGDRDYPLETVAGSA